MLTKEHYSWDEETSTATCIYTVNGRDYIGIARCCPEDADMCSQKTGYEIARRRAAIEYFKYERYKTNIILEDVLAHLWNPLQGNKKFEEPNFVSKELKLYVETLKSDKEYLSNVIRNCKIELQLYIKEKDIFYTQLRKIRNKTKIDNN